MINVLPEIKKLLIAEGVTTTIKMSYLPDRPKTVVAILDTGGTEPDPNATAKEIEHKAFQIFVRSESYTGGVAIMQQVRDALHQVIAHQDDTAPACHFMNILLNAEPGYLGKNEHGLHDFSANFRTKVRPIA